MRHMSFVRSRQQQGLTLIELMIAMVLGLLVVSGTVQIFLSGKSAYRLQEGLGRLQESARFADFMLDRVLRQAGRPWVFGATDGIPGDFFRPVDNRTDGDGVALTRDGAQASPDVITVMYRSDVNCLGNSTDYGSQTIVDHAGNRYARDQFYINAHNPPSLACRGLGRSGAPVPGHTQPLVAGVEDFQVLYGVDTDADGRANRYENATRLQEADWLRVVSLKFAVLVSSDVPARSTPDEKTYALLDAAPRGPFADGRLRQVVESTVVLRNRAP